jgi:hypothetical protein
MENAHMESTNEKRKKEEYTQKSNWFSLSIQKESYLYPFHIESLEKQTVKKGGV